MARTPTSPRGRTEGYVLLDALLAVLVTALFAAAILGGLALVSRGATAALDKARAAIESRNAYTMEALDAASR